MMQTSFSRNQKSRTLTIGLGLVGIFAAMVTMRPQVDWTKASQTAASNVQAATTNVNQDPSGTIDGAKTPNSIPDDVAYSLFFSFVTSHASLDKKHALVAYMKHYELQDVNAEELISAARKLDEAVSALNSSLANRPRSHSLEEELKQKKAAVVNEAVSSLPNYVGVAGANKVRQHVIEHMKQQIKLVPYAPMPSMP